MDRTCKFVWNGILIYALELMLVHAPLKYPHMFV